MPSTRIDTQRGWIKGRQLEIIEAIQCVLVDVIKIPTDDRNIRLFEYDSDSMIVPAGKSQSYMMIEVSLFEGRTDATKISLFAALAEALAQFGIVKTDIDVMLNEIPRNNWGIGGVSANNIELSYQIAI